VAEYRLLIGQSVEELRRRDQTSMRIILCKGQLYGPISGSDETLVTYASELLKAGHDVSVLLIYLHAEEDQYYQRLLAAGVPVSWMASNLAHTSMGAGRKLAYKLFDTVPGLKHFIRRRAQRVATMMAKRYYRPCRSFLETQNPDLVHVMTPDPNAMVMIKASHDAGIPVIYQELGIPYHPPDFEAYYRQFTSVVPLCSEIVALSPTLSEHCREQLPASKGLSVLPIMCEESVNGNNGSQRSDRKITFGFAARMEELKGPMVLMNAFGIAYQECREICLNIAGDGTQRKKIAARAKALDVAGRYRYHGVYTHPKEMRAFMQSLDVFVMPSFTEGTPNSIVEAMSQGKPIIASNVGGIPDMIGEEAGLLVPAGDAGALGAAMLQLARDPMLRERMGRAARLRYQNFFSPEAVVPLMLETYRRVANNGSNGSEIKIAVAGNKQTHPWSTAHV